MKTLKLSTIFSTLLLLIASCGKDTYQPACETNKTGTITISNSSSNPYNIYIDGVYQIQLSGGSVSKKLTITEGNGRQLYAVQVSGYLLYPTERQSTFNVLSCTDYSWQIP